MSTCTLQDRHIIRVRNLNPPSCPASNFHRYSDTVHNRNMQCFVNGWNAALAAQSRFSVKRLPSSPDWRAATSLTFLAWSQSKIFSTRIGHEVQGHLAKFPATLSCPKLRQTSARGLVHNVRQRLARCTNPPDITFVWQVTGARRRRRRRWRRRRRRRWW